MSHLRRDFLRRLSSLPALAVGGLALAGTPRGAGSVKASTPQSAVSHESGGRKRVLKSANAPTPIGPFSHGIQAGNLIFFAGLTGIDVKTGKIVPGGIVAETRQALDNIKAILAEAGATLDNAVASTVHMTDLIEFQQMNEVYAQYFGQDPPGRTTVQVVAIPAGARVEITIVAAV